MKGFVAILCFIFYPLLAQADQITVAGASNVQFTLEELAREFTQETGIDVKSVVASSGKLTAQIENGAPFDVFMSADIDYPQRLYTDGLTLAEPKVYALGSLVLWSLKKVDLSKGISILTEPWVASVALASPKAAPYGRQAVNVMKFYHLYTAIESKLVYAESVSQVNQFVTTQAADFGFTAKSVVLSENMIGKGGWIDIDQAAYKPIAQAVVVLKSSKNRLMADKFYQFLFTPKAQAIFTKYGYKLP